MPATFTQHFQVRFDECAADGTVRAPALLRYVVETAFGHSAREGFPLTWYEARGLFWLVRRVHLDLPASIPYGTVLAVTTEVLGFRRIWARRRNTLQDGAGRSLGVVTVDWIFTDREGNPSRVVPEMAAAFPVPSERLQVDRLELGPAPPGTVPTAYRVPAHQVDPRGHMNSAAYLDLLDDALTEAGGEPQRRPAVIEAEYLRAALSGEVLQQFVWPDADGWAMAIETADGQPVVLARWQPRAP